MIFLEVEVVLIAIAHLGQIRDARELDHRGGAAHERDRVIRCLREVPPTHLLRDKALSVC